MICKKDTLILTIWAEKSSRGGQKNKTSAFIAAQKQLRSLLLRRTENILRRTLPDNDPAVHEMLTKLPLFCMVFLLIPILYTIIISC